MRNSRSATGLNIQPHSDEGTDPGFSKKVRQPIIWLFFFAKNYTEMKKNGRERDDPLLPINAGLQA